MYLLTRDLRPNIHLQVTVATSSFIDDLSSDVIIIWLAITDAFLILIDWQNGSSIELMNQFAASKVSKTVGCHNK